MPSRPILEFSGVIKDYHGLRPLRVKDLVVVEAEMVALSGLDLPAAETLTNLSTGAALPDEGTVRLFGADTRAIGDADEWLAGLDRLGIVSPRVALLEGFTVEQNIALPLTIDLDPLRADIAAKSRALAAEVGIDAECLAHAAGRLDPETALRLRLARAIAPAPRLLLVEHPTATLSRAQVAKFAMDLVRLVRSRRLTVLVVTADEDLSAAADRRLTLDAATGVTRPPGIRGWFR